MSATEHRIVYDPKLMRPACVLLQAIWGGDSHIVNRHFDSDTWLIAPTPDMRLFSGTDLEIEKLAEMTRRIGAWK